MPVPVLVSVAEYLSTSYEPDREFVHGELVERNVGDYWHSSLQGWIAHIFLSHAKRLGIRPMTEQRVRLSSDVYRIPDVCVVPVPNLMPGVLTSPPLLTVEITSPDDRWTAVVTKAEEYRNFGVGHVWIVDAQDRKVYAATQRGLEVSAAGNMTFTSHNGEKLDVPFQEIFSDIAADLES